MGGGLELAMMCDMLVVGENAQLASQNRRHYARWRNTTPDPCGRQI